MKTIKNSIAIIMAVLILACNSAPKNEMKTQDIMLQNITSQEQNTAADTTATIDALALRGTRPSSNVDWDKKIIKTADVTLELKDYNAYNKAIHSLLRNYGAYIASELQNESEGKIQNVVSIKVPVDNFENLVGALPTEEAKVLEKHISTEDVTGQVIDTKARTDAKKQVRDRYLSLLKQAKNMKEILEVQREINSMQEDIEAGNGRVEYLAHQSAYSTINLTYFQYTEGNRHTGSPLSFFIKMKEAFNDGSSIFTGSLILLVSFWPLIIIGCFLWFYLKRTRTVKRNNAV